MASPAPRRARRSRGSIDTDLILRGAFEVARREGLDGMSMPGLAAHLEVGVTSIYWYFRSKEELLQQMYQTAAQDLEDRMIGPSGVDPAQWRAHFIAVFEQIRSAFADDDVLAELLMHPQAGHSGVATLAAFQRVEDELALLVAAGFTRQRAWLLWSTLWMYTQGVVISETARRRSGQPPTGTSQLTLLSVSTMPLLAQLVTDDGITIDGTGSAFRPGLELILDTAGLADSDGG